MKWKLALITLALFSNSFADPRTWDLDGLSVRQAYDLNWQGQTARADDGSVMMVWTDARNGFFELFGQLLSPEGEPQWGDGGRFLARSEGIGIYWPVITYSLDGWVVIWQDDDSYNTSEEIVIHGRVKVMKFAASGLPMWTDPEQTGIELYNEQSHSLQEGTSWVEPDGTGGAYVCWINENDFFAQHVATDEVIDWEVPIQFNHQFAGWGYAVGSNGAGNLVLVWKSSNAGYYDINCRMIAPDGSNVWASPAVVCHVPNYVTSLNLVADGAGGVVVVWFDERQESVLDIYAQRVSTTGVTQWQANGVPIVAGGLTKFGLEIAASIDGEVMDGVLVKWEETSLVGMDGYTQKFDFDGDVLWQAGGVQLCEPVNPDDYQEMITAVSDMHGGALYGWRETLSDTWPDNLRLSRLDATGQAVWGGCAVSIVEGGHVKIPRIAVAGDGNVVSIWRESNNLDGLMFAHSHDLATGVELIPEALSLDGMIDGEGFNHTMLALPEGRVAVAWQDLRQDGRQLYFQILDAESVNEYPQDGIKLVEVAEGVYPQLENLSLCGDGSGGFFAAFTDISSGTRVVRATHWNAEGEQVGPVEGTLVSNPEFDAADQMQVVSDSAGGAFVVFTMFDELFLEAVYAMRIDANCQPHWEEPVRISTDVDYDDWLAGSVASDNGSCIAVYQTGAFPIYTYRATKVTANGVVDWSISATSSERIAEDVQVTTDLNGGVAMVWQYEDVPSVGDIYAQRISADGELAWAEEGLPVEVTEGNQYSPRVSVDDQGNMIVAWLNMLPQSENDLIAQKISPTGAFLWPVGGVLIDQASVNTALSSVVAVNYENLYFTWTAVPEQSSRRLVYVSHLNALGELADDPFWQPAGTVLCDAADVFESPKAIATDDGGVVVTWGDWRARDFMTSVYAQRIYDPIPTAVHEQPMLPTEFSLSQNYPNPFNPETVIEFALPTASKATMKVFDVTGREIATLLDQPLAAGAHRVNFSAQGLPSGVYFYTLRAAEYSMTRKMVLLR